MNSKKAAALVQKIVRRYGPVIDLRANPQSIIDIIRRFADDIPDGGQPCGGVPMPPAPPEPPPPPDPPGPSKVASRVTNDDVMKAVQQLAREVSTIKKSIVTGQRNVAGGRTNRR